MSCRRFTPVIMRGYVIYSWRGQHLHDRRSRATDGWLIGSGCHHLKVTRLHPQRAVMQRMMLRDNSQAE